YRHRTTVFAFLTYRHIAHPDLHSFPTRRSSDLNVTTGDTALTIIEDINQHMEHLNVDQVIADFHTLNPNKNPYRLEEDTSYYFRSEEHTSELQSRFDLVCRLLLRKKNYQH